MKASEQLLAELSKLKGEECPFNRVLCSTCGGLVGKLRRNMTNDLRDKIESLLKEILRDDFSNMGDWGDALVEYYSRFEEKSIRDCLKLS